MLRNLTNEEIDAVSGAGECDDVETFDLGCFDRPQQTNSFNINSYDTGGGSPYRLPVLDSRFDSGSDRNSSINSGFSQSYYGSTDFGRYPGFQDSPSSPSLNGGSFINLGNDASFGGFFTGPFTDPNGGGGVFTYGF